ncbi:putative G-protein coupled receptors family 1 profile domain-containing protein [Seiridium cardinale]|uniref:G-protein coupled receptors family 1 profile domain-containing protein n=1 Tax=Seiridium cardinale TaxID=138064 RepID=A0ABR2XVG6_9PEZI
MPSMTFGDFSSLTPAQQAQLLNGPALKPPAGEVSNLDNPPNEDILYHVVQAIFMALITVSLLGRICIRFWTKQQHIVDYLLILTYALTVTNLVICYRMAMTTGAFVHQWNVRMADLLTFLRLTFVLSAVQIFATPLLKVSILLEWIRIFVPKGTRNFTYWASYALIWINVIYYGVGFITLNIACTPYEYSWNKLIHGDCNRVNTGLTNLAASAFNLITDVLILMIPQKAIWSLQMTPKRKLGVSVAFAVGILGIAAAAARLAMGVVRASSNDFTYNFAAVVLCSGSEVTAGFLVVCIPAFPKAFNHSTLSKVTSSLRSWGSKQRLRARNRSVGSSMPQSKNSESRFNQDSLEVGGYDASSIRQLHATNSAELSLYEHSHALESGIVRTTQFAMNERYDPNATSADRAREQALHGIR